MNNREEYGLFDVPEPLSSEERREQLNELYRTIAPAVSDIMEHGRVMPGTLHKAVGALANVKDKDLEDLSYMFAAEEWKDREFGIDMPLASVKGSADDLGLQKYYFVELGVMRARAKDFLKRHPVEKQDWDNLVDRFMELGDIENLREAPPESLLAVASLEEEDLRRFAEYYGYQSEVVPDTFPEPLPSSIVGGKPEHELKIKSELDKEAFMQIYEDCYKTWLRAKKAYAEIQAGSFGPN